MTNEFAPGTLAHALRLWQCNHDYKKLAPRTHIGWGAVYRKVEQNHLGAVKVKELHPVMVREFLDLFGDRPGTQKTIKAALKVFESWALQRAILPHPFMTGIKVKGPDGHYEPWTDEHVRIAEQHAAPVFSKLVTLAANTGQRGSDVVKMQWSDISALNGHPGINIIQVKTGKRLWVPMTDELIAAIRRWGQSNVVSLDGKKHLSGPIVVNKTGRPWTREYLSKAWIRERRTNPFLKPHLDLGLSFHGLRATAVIRLRRKNVSPALIADAVGMSVPVVEVYCKRADQALNALAAIEALQGGKGADDKSLGILGL